MFGAPQITSIADLRDKRVGITRFGSIVANSARLLLRTGGLTPPDDVVLLQLEGFPEIDRAHCLLIEGWLEGLGHALSAVGMASRCQPL